VLPYMPVRRYVARIHNLCSKRSLGSAARPVGQAKDSRHSLSRLSTRAIAAATSSEPKPARSEELSTLARSAQTPICVLARSSGSIALGIV